MNQPIRTPKDPITTLEIHDEHMDRVWLTKNGLTPCAMVNTFGIENARQDADEIVRRVNTQPDLLAALKGLLANAPAPNGVKRDFSYILYREAATKAIAKAEGRQ